MSKKKLKVYLDTSVIGGCFDLEFAKESIQLMDQINNNVRIGVISELTEKELESAPQFIREYYEKIKDNLIILKFNNKIEELASSYLDEGIVNQKFRNDCLHIAYATVYEVDMLVSWNFKHIVNYEKIIKFISVNVKKGYKPLQIFSPMEAIKQNE